MVSTLLKKNYIAVYSFDKKLLGRFENSFEIENTGRSEKKINVLKINPNGTFKIKVYRGKIRALEAEGKIRLVNVLPLEEYVAGVLPNEMPQYFPPEALKSMGLINRTFAVSNFHRHENEGFDVCSSVHCQVYDGVLSEEKSTTQAAGETEGELVYYEGKLAATTFHSCCGGMLENVELVWPNHPPFPYLTALPDSPSAGNLVFNNEDEFKKFIDSPPQSYCQKAGRFRWKETYSKTELEKLFKESLPVYFNDYLDFGNIADIKITRRSLHGRVQEMVITGTYRLYIVKKDSIRWLFSKGKIGTGGLQSTLFYISRDYKGNYVFNGGGWGHGVGLCQEGACGMANAGFTYKEISRHFYPGTEIIKSINY